MAVHCRTGRARYAIPDGPAREAPSGPGHRGVRGLGWRTPCARRFSDGRSWRRGCVVCWQRRGTRGEGVTWEPADAPRASGRPRPVRRPGGARGVGTPRARPRAGHRRTPLRLHEPGSRMRGSVSRPGAAPPAVGRVGDARLPDVSVDARRVAQQPTRGRATAAAIAADLGASRTPRSTPARPPVPGRGDIPRAARPGPIPRNATTPPQGPWPALARPCPLCRFPATEVRPTEPALDAIGRPRPDWRRAGVCGRCADRYRFTHRLGG